MLDIEKENVVLVETESGLKYIGDAAKVIYEAQKKREYIERLLRDYPLFNNEEE